METEIEAKWLNVDIDDLRKRLEQACAVLVAPERLMVRRTFDYPDRRLDKVGGWVRVRDEGGEVTMSYKQLKDRSVSGTEEITVVVDDFEAACNFLTTIGLETKSLQETRRESWKLDEAEVEIDTWPWIPSFVEIEAKSEENLKSVAQKLSLDYSQALHGSVETAYQAVYDVSEEEVNSWPEISFTDLPEWLRSKKK